MPGVKISDLPLTTLQGPDIFPVARAGITLGVRASDILNRFTNNETNVTDLSSRTITVVDSPTIDLTYNSVTRVLSADLQQTLDLRSRTVFLPLTAEIPPGTVMSFLGRSAPPGWLICNGQIVPNGVGPVQGVVANYSRLFTVLGTTYGTTPGTLPDLRGYFIRGYGSAADLAIGDNVDGTESGPFGQKVADSFQGHKHGLYDPPHDHTATTAPGGGAHTHDYVDVEPKADDGCDSGSADNGSPWGVGVNKTTGSGGSAHDHTIVVSDDSTGARVLSPTGDTATPGAGDVNGPGGSTPRVGFETKPKNVALLWCVKY